MPRALALALTTCLLITFVQALQVRRPCLNVVRYVDQQDTRLIAEISLKDPSGVEGVWLNITLDQEAQVLANKFGPATTLDNHNFLIKRLDVSLLAGEQYIVRILIKHNDVVTPNIVKVLLNGRSICPGSILAEEKQCPFCPEPQKCGPNNEISGIADNQTVNIARLGEDITDTARRPPVELIDVKRVCGTVTITKDKIHSGILAEEGNYPWQMALIHTTGGNINYVCSAGLISQRFALTAAHCVVVKSSGAVKPKDEYRLYAGTTKINTKTEYVQEFQLASITVHEQYEIKHLENDIAILGMKTTARIDDYVRPICLPTEKMLKQDLYDRRGIVAGWGYTENGLVSDLKYAGMPIVSSDQCIFSDRAFYSKFISPKVFCAGAKNGTVVCEGDSGAPLAVEGTAIGDEDKFYIRGIVSLSKQTFGKKCSPWDYAIFTDVKSYVPWIKGFVDV